MKPVLLSFVLAAAVPGAAWADTFCNLPQGDWSAILAPVLSGAWQTEALSGLAFVEGDVMAMPERVEGIAQLRAEGGRLFLNPPNVQGEVELLPAAGEDWDLSMGSEPPLPAEEVFADPTFGFGLACPLSELPRYRAEGRVEDELGGVTFTLYLVVPDAERAYAVTTADLDAPDGTRGVARVVTRFTR